MDRLFILAFAPILGVIVARLLWSLWQQIKKTGI